MFDDLIEDLFKGDIEEMKNVLDEEVPGNKGDDWGEDENWSTGKVPNGVWKQDS